MSEFEEALMDCYEDNFGKYPKSCEGCQHKRKCESIEIKERDEDGRPTVWVHVLKSPSCSLLEEIRK